MIAIPNMEKPKDCWECSFAYLWANGSTYCMADGQELYCDGVTTRNDCPLIDIDLIRCGECKKHGKNSCPMTFTYAVITDDNNYCSYAERRTDE